MPTQDNIEHIVAYKVDDDDEDEDDERREEQDEVEQPDPVYYISNDLRLQQTHIPITKFRTDLHNPNKDYYNRYVPYVFFQQRLMPLTV